MRDCNKKLNIEQIEELRASLIRDINAFKEFNNNEAKRDIEFYLINTDKLENSLALFCNYCECFIEQSGNEETERKYVEVIEGFINLGADFNKKPWAVMTPLFTEARKGNVKIVEYLLSLGAKVDLYYKEFNHHKVTPLMIAAQNGRDAVVNTLLNAGAMINKRDSEGYRAIDYACMNGRTSTAKLLISRGSIAPRKVK